MTYCKWHKNSKTTPRQTSLFQVHVLGKKLDVDQFQNVHCCCNGLSGSCLGSLKRGIQTPNSAFLKYRDNESGPPIKLEVCAD
ncbi:hypothetical protein ACE6H2_006532 [Prunus campanulata]